MVASLPEIGKEFTVCPKLLIINTSEFSVFVLILTKFSDGFGARIIILVSILLQRGGPLFMQHMMELSIMLEQIMQLV